MKARNNKTGEIVTAFNISSEFGTVSYIDSTGVLRITNPCSGEWTILEECDVINWYEFHANSTKSILCALLSDNDGYHGDGDNQAFVTQAIGLADELVNQLKCKYEA